MPSLTFLGIENPLGVLGQKIKGVINNQDQLNPIKNVIDDAFGVSKYRGHHQKYEFRVNCINQDFQKDLVKDTILNREYVLKLLKNKKYPYVRLAMCSSLNSLLKYLDNYCGLNQTDKFDTVIIYGHGPWARSTWGLDRSGSNRTCLLDMMIMNRERDAPGVRLGQRHFRRQNQKAGGAADTRPERREYQRLDRRIHKDSEPCGT